MVRVFLVGPANVLAILGSTPKPKEERGLSKCVVGMGGGSEEDGVGERLRRVVD